ncbi:hypothetical protein ACWOE3_11295 [Enterococcus dispar]|uniref:Lipoprotein n=1 Tax=Enterococcus dispar ATCC 51266 TaxID=1139219 RepID=S0KX40_9ENTE|nr:hypothetical protein [Enterococcus dispar]EOT43771.1 hypothetical protein OMK_00329 [Enterococcus dispar ATCC 51266]EOW85557.1 hypothetical protein I569_00870 [Enterococcus dispar ATCC 51266]OJG36603.1 hypothetical protein RV01_GL001597 [Enterococcus dispar]
MKKVILGIAFLLALTGCTSKEASIDITKNQDEGIYDYIYGKSDETIKSVSGEDQAGNTLNVDVAGKEFQAAVPALLNDQSLDLKIEYSNGNESNQKIKLKGRLAIDEYPNFVALMNDRIVQTNDKAKTEFPFTVEDGITTVSDVNGVKTNINVQDGKILGINMTSESDVDKEMATIIVAFQESYHANNEGVSDAYNNALDSKKKTSFESNGFKFTFEKNGNELFADIAKVK